MRRDPLESSMSARVRRYALLFLLGTSAVAAGSGCKPKPDEHLVEGRALLLKDPKAALKEFQSAKEPESEDALLGQGLAHEELQQFAEAEKAYERLRQKADKPDVWLALVRTRIMQGNLAEARAGIDKVVAKVPADLSALLLEACLANDEARAKAAMTRLDQWPARRAKTAAERPPPTDFHLARATLLARVGEPEGARLAAEAAEKASFVEDGFSATLATLAARAGQRGFAQLLTERLAASFKEPPVMRRVAALAYGLEQHAVTAKALDYLTTDNDPEVVRLRALNDVALKRPAAIQSLNAAIAVTKDPASLTELRLMLAEALTLAGRRGEARGTLEILDAQNASLTAAKLQLARIDVFDRKPKDAIQRLEPLNQPGAPPRLHEILASAYIDDKQLEKARAELEAVLSAQPANLEALALLASLLEKAGPKGASIARIEKQIAAAPKDLGLRLLLSDVRIKLGQPKEAEEGLRQTALALKDDHRAYAALARLQQSRKGWDDAVRTLEEADKAKPNSVPVAVEFAALYTRKGEGKKALPYYDRILRFAKDDPFVLNNTAMLYADELGDGVRAVELAERAHKLQPKRADMKDTLAWALLKRNAAGDVARAKELLLSIKNENASATGKYHLATALLPSDEAQAKTLLREALAQPGEFPEASAARKLLGDST